MIVWACLLSCLLYSALPVRSILSVTCCYLFYTVYILEITVKDTYSNSWYEPFSVTAVVVRSKFLSHAFWRGTSMYVGRHTSRLEPRHWNLQSCSHEGFHLLWHLYRGTVYEKQTRSITWPYCRGSMRRFSSSVTASHSFYLSTNLLCICKFRIVSTVVLKLMKFTFDKTFKQKYSITLLPTNENLICIFG